MTDETLTNEGGVLYAVKDAANRFNKGKLEWHLLPLMCLVDCVRVFTYGRDKYSEWDWIKGASWIVQYDCLMRHMQAWYEREDDDPESALPHLGHAMCNLVMLSFYTKFFKDRDDRPTFPKGEKE